MSEDWDFTHIYGPSVAMGSSKTAETQFANLLAVLSLSPFTRSAHLAMKAHYCSSNRIPIGTFRLNVPMGL
jgi:hypothetical protein